MTEEGLDKEELDRRQAGHRERWTEDKLDRGQAGQRERWTEV